MQQVPREPGEDYPTRVAAEWLPESTVLVVSSRFGVFALGHPSMVEELGKEDLLAGRTAFRQARKVDRVSVTRIHVHDDGTVDERGAPSHEPPPESPPGWFDDITAALQAHDDEVRARIRNELFGEQAKATQEQHARDLLQQFLREDLTAQQPPELTMRLSGGEPESPHLMIKHGRIHHGRLMVGPCILLLRDELQRRAITDQLRASGHEVLEPLDGWHTPPRLIAEVAWVGLWQALRLTLGVEFDPHDPKPNPVAALYFPAEQAMICAADAWEPYVRELLAWHGLPVARTLDFESPDGYDPLLYNRLSWRLDLLLQGLENARQRMKPTPGRKPRTLRATAGRRVSPPVAVAIEEILVSRKFQRFEVGPGGHRGWAHRSGILTRQQADQLTAAVAPVDLSEAAKQAVADAGSISRKHLPLLAAMRLRTLDPSWWESLPWQTPMRGPRRGISRKYPSTEPVPVEWLAEMTPAQVAESAQPRLVELLKSGPLPVPDLPQDFTVADQIRIYVTAAALLHAGYAAEGVAARGSAMCAICSRGFPMDSLTLNSLTFTQSAQYCRDCADEAQFGAPARWTQLRATGAHAAIQELVELTGGPPPRVALAAPLRGLKTADRTRHMLLRQVLPNVHDNSVTIPSWGTLLAEAGVLGEGWRPSYGTYTIAEDGHRCRSLLERFVDDFLSSRGIAHELEPEYPFDPEYNPNGSRADWLIDGAYVEAAGMMGKAEYRRKMDTKRALAGRHGLELVLVQPEDVAHLETVFSRWLPDG